MKIGEKVGTHTSPKREVRKAGERVERPIPVEIPEKVPQKAENDFHFVGRMWFGLDQASLYGDRSFLVTSIIS